MGRTHGETNEMKPAPKAANSETFSTMALTPRAFGQEAPGKPVAAP
jgi:hypothetical protein